MAYSTSSSSYDANIVYQDTSTTSPVSQKLSIPTSTSSWTNMASVTAHDHKMKFDINGEIVEFNSKEIIRLKEMLTEWITDKHPEDLL